MGKIRKSSEYSFYRIFALLRRRLAAKKSINLPSLNFTPTRFGVRHFKRTWKLKKLQLILNRLTFALFDFVSFGFWFFWECVHIWPRLATFRRRDTFWIDSTDSDCGSFCRFCTVPVSDIADTRSGLKLSVWRSPELEQ